jgi:hypothetical protein
MVKKTLIKNLLVTSALSLSLVSGLSAADEQKYIIATASTGGTYYPVGVGIATIASIKLAKKYNITFSAMTSAGSNENIDMMEKGEVKFAILQGLFGSMAWQGTGAYEGKPKKNLRSVSMLWQNVEHFTVYKKYAKTGNIMDMKNLYGEGFSIGARNSGTRVSNETMLSSLGIDYNKMDIRYLAYVPSSNALQDGKIQGFGIPGGSPVGAVTNAFATIGAKNIKVLDFNADDLKKISDNYPVWTPFTVKAGTYPGQETDIHTIAQPNLLVVTEDTPEETVYLLTKTIYENLPFLQSVHKATLAMSLQKAIDGLPMPLHPGAARYYKEMGIKIPARLIAN